MNPEELDLIETSDLMEALFRRCKTGVIMLIQERDEATEAEAFASKGNEYHALGLCNAMAARFNAIIGAEFLAGEAEE